MQGFDRFLATIRQGRTQPVLPANIRGLVDPASTSRIALLCYGRDHDQCHRTCILDIA
ncbi:MAG: DUF488 domain-containing protein [Acidimicrobiaceae bacterium]|nr:DUF488 domain-containing protein [Acidimicrobiaceae bacterium]MYC43561.1 DUF488 domain-containing protein [Acidimicrobiaceae bacterium]MYH87373.1 DUF488 domain-containing protein [Acidimicrobiaceae bacterium]